MPGEVQLRYFNTNEMIADIFTKALTKDRMMMLMSGLGVVEQTSTLARGRGGVLEGDTAPLA